MAKDLFRLSTRYKRPGRKFWLTAGLILGFYTFLVLLFLPQVFLYSLESPKAPPWYTFAWRLAIAHYLWALLTPLVFWLGGRLPIERGKLLRNLSLHFIFSLLFAAFHTIAYQHIAGFFDGDGFAQVNTALFRSRAVFLNYVTNGFVFYAGILAFNQAANYAVKYRDREFRLQQAELAALKTQLHPHFLFNTLNAISALVYVSPPAATATISQLSDLLRLTLRNNKAQEVTLKEELDFLRKYLQIQQTLLQERLEIIWGIAPETLDALVPNMLLQPLVENSIRHGIAPREDGGRIEIFSRYAGRELLLEIRDNGPDLVSIPQNGLSGSGGIGHGGIGLLNSRMRLKRLYGEAQKFESEAVPGGGWRVSVIIPFRENTLGGSSK
ncbi:MAG TPA: histidine kinase [Pyrinomonadaceae bacterium]|jgi:signal transduction histidine kinase|nr:histidine kinase [Pyrinomonadaceae bacterium]